MTDRCPSNEDTEPDRIDRKLIMVDFPPVQAGIAAALRRAFMTPRDEERNARNLETLLQRLN